MLRVTTSSAAGILIYQFNNYTVSCQNAWLIVYLCSLIL